MHVCRERPLKNVQSILLHFALWGAPLREVQFFFLHVWALCAPKGTTHLSHPVRVKKELRAGCIPTANNQTGTSNKTNSPWMNWERWKRRYEPEQPRQTTKHQTPKQPRNQRPKQTNSKLTSTRNMRKEVKIGPPDTDHSFPWQFRSDPRPDHFELPWATCEWPFARFGIHAHGWLIQWFLSTRLETRTKESCTHASSWNHVWPCASWVTLIAASFHPMQQ